MADFNPGDVTASEYKLIVQVMMFLSWIGFRGNTAQAIHTAWPTQLLDLSLDEMGQEIESVVPYFEALPPGTQICDLDLHDGTYKKYTREHMLTEYDFKVCGYLFFPLQNPSWIIHKVCDPVSAPRVFDIRELCVRLTDLPKEIPVG